MNLVLWWGIYTFAGIWGSFFFPGVDFLAPGMLLCIQLGKRNYIIWLTLLWSLLQDGSGGLPFGYSFLWYLSIFALYRCCAMFFNVQGIMFATLCGALLGFLHIFLTGVMSMLADIVWAKEICTYEAMLQFLFFPMVWLFIKSIYPERLKDEPAI